MPSSEELRMVEIRAVRPNDLDDLYRVCLATGAGGDDASPLYRDPRLVGHVYAAPYAILSPRSVFVVEDTLGVGGYIVGAPDTRDFETRLEAEWWPSLRTLYQDPSNEPRTGWSPDQSMIHMIHHPRRTARMIVEPYPSHLHINLLPRLRGRGFGRQLIGRWLETVRQMGSRGAHLAVGAANRRAIEFYRACGLHEITVPSRPPSAALWFAIDLMPGTGGSCVRQIAG
jgi:ribosomal protein S18 acetylase RimI-like enzyme